MITTHDQSQLYLVLEMLDTHGELGCLDEDTALQHAVDSVYNRMETLHVDLENFTD